MKKNICQECGKKAKWFVWYGIGECNAGGNSFCTKHVIKEMKNGRDGYKVTIIHRVNMNRVQV
jgi:hypothetical protein